MQHVKRLSLSYCHLWPVGVYSIFQHYFINDTIFGNKVIVHTSKLCVLIFLQTFLSEIFLIIRKTERAITINVLYICLSVCLHATYRYSCHILMRLEVSPQISEKQSNIKFHENPVSGSRVVPCGRTNGHDEVNSNFLRFRERAYKSHFLFSKRNQTLKPTRLYF